MTLRAAAPAGVRYDLVIVGGGPAGLSAAAAARDCGLSHLLLERGDIAQTIADYPLRRPLHSPPEEVELQWGALHWTSPPLTTREDVLAHYRTFAGDRQLNVQARETVEAIEGRLGNFVVHATHGDYRAFRVIVATGGFGIVRPLGVPGVTPDRVSYRFVEGSPCRGMDVLVVGGGNSAAEAALYLHECGARVTLSLRRETFAPRDGITDAFASVKEMNSARLSALAAARDVTVLFSSRLAGITPDAAIVAVDGESQPRVVHCGHVFALLGADPDVSLLRQAGAAIAPDGRPVYEPRTYETTVTGLHVIGHLSRELHIRNAIVVGSRVVRRLAGESAPADTPLIVATDCAVSLVKAARSRSVFARRIIRRSAALRRFVHRVEIARVLHDKRPWKQRVSSVLGWNEQRGQSAAATTPTRLENARGATRAARRARP